MPKTVDLCNSERPLTHQWNELYISNAAAGTWSQTSDGTGVTGTASCQGQYGCVTNDILVVDINMDGNMDLYCSNDGKNFLFLGDGNGGFTGGTSGNGYYDIFTVSGASGNGHKKAIAADVCPRGSSLQHRVAISILL